MRSISRAKFLGTRGCSLSTWRIFWREQEKSECDWVVMSSLSVASQSSSPEQIRRLLAPSGKYEPIFDSINSECLWME
jgi:hypothetical protein